MYSQKIIRDLKPDWYLQLSSKQKKAENRRMEQDHSLAWKNKPNQIPSGTKIIAKESCNSLTKGNVYIVKKCFSTLVTTIYFTEWHHFVTLKNKYGWTVKMNIRKFEKIVLP